MFRKLSLFNLKMSRTVGINFNPNFDIYPKADVLHGQFYIDKNPHSGDVVLQQAFGYIKEKNSTHIILSNAGNITSYQVGLLKKTWVFLQEIDIQGLSFRYKRRFEFPRRLITKPTLRKCSIFFDHEDAYKLQENLSVFRYSPIETIELASNVPVRMSIKDILHPWVKNLQIYGVIIPTEDIPILLDLVKNGASLSTDYQSLPYNKCSEFLDSVVVGGGGLELLSPTDTNFTTIGDVDKILEIFQREDYYGTIHIGVTQTTEKLLYIIDKWANFIPHFTFKVSGYNCSIQYYGIIAMIRRRDENLHRDLIRRRFDFSKIFAFLHVGVLLEACRFL